MLTVRKFGACLVMATMLFVGCDKESSTKTTTETKTPDGKTTVTTEKTVETSGSAPPASGSNPTGS